MSEDREKGVARNMQEHRMLFGTTRAVITTAITVAVVLAFWVVGPLARRG